jgi:hypothetical protein
MTGAPTREAVYYTIDGAAERLHKSRRWLQDWLRGHPADRFGTAFYAQLGRTKLFTDEGLSRLLAACMEDQRCHLSSSRRVRAGASSGGYAAPTLDATLTEALALSRRPRREIPQEARPRH